MESPASNLSLASDRALNTVLEDNNYRSLAREVLSLAIPAIAQLIVQSLVFVADRMMLGYYSVAALASLEISNLLINCTVQVLCFYVATIEQLFMAIGVFMTRVLQIRGDTQMVTVISLLGWLVVRLSALYFFVFVLDLGLVGFWLGLTCDWFVRTLALSVLFFHQQRWQQAGE